MIEMTTSTLRLTSALAKRVHIVPSTRIMANMTQQSTSTLSSSPRQQQQRQRHYRQQQQQQQRQHQHQQFNDNGRNMNMNQIYSTMMKRRYSSDDNDKRKSLSNKTSRNTSSENGEQDKKKDGAGGNSNGGRGGGNGRDGKGDGRLFLDQNERMQRIFDRLKKRLPEEMREHFEPGSVNFHICKTLMLLMDEKYLTLLPRAIEEFDRAIELAQQHRQFSFIDTIGQSFLRDQVTMHGGRRGYDLVLSLFMGLLHERKEPQDAIRMYNSVLDMEGVIAETYYCRGICNMRGIEDYHSAKEDLEMVIRLRSDFYQAYDQLGVLIGTMHMVHDSPQAQEVNRKSALRLFDQAIEINEQYAPAYTNRAVVMMEQDPHRALRDLETSLRLDELNGYTHQQLGALYMNHLKKFEKALECFNRALQLQPHNPSLYQFRSILYQKMGRQSEADQDLRTAQDVHEDLQRDMTVARHY